MGIYINPKDDQTPFDKIKAIREHGERITIQEFKAISPGRGGVFGVAVINNGNFLAAGVAFHPGETEEFAGVTNRPVEFYSMTIDNIRKIDPPVADMLQHYVTGIE